MTAHHSDPVATAPDSTRGGRLLVVDDDPAVRMFVSQVLTKQGHAVVQAGGVDEAVGRLAGGEFDVALVDLDMPGRSGLELLTEIRTAGIEVVPVLLTGTSDVGAAVAGMKLGATDYLCKPATPDALRWTVGRAVGTARGRRRERVLERVAAEWEATFDACPDLLLVVDPADRVVRANRAATVRAGLAPGEAAGLPVTALFPGDLGAAIVRTGSSPDSTTGPPTAVYDQNLDEYFLITRNQLAGRAGPSPGTVVVARDVTPLVRAEKARADLLRRVFSAQEHERRRIAVELHDGIGQALVSLSIGLGSAAEGDLGDVRDRFRQLGRVAAEALEDTRRMAHGLRPTVLDDFGLTVALSRLTEQFNQAHPTRATFSLAAPVDGRLPAEVESAVFRIAQESLANIAKHARAATAAIALDVVGDELSLMVTDDGVGFPADDRQYGFGLTGIRERAVLLGGTCRVESAAGRGTSVEVRFPLPRS